MRKLNGHDIFMALRVVKSLGVQEEMKSIAESFSTGKRKNVKAEEVGYELIMNILGNCGDEQSENSILAFLSGPMETDPETMKNMDAIDFMNSIKEMVALNDKDAWTGFFKSVGNLLK